jgi:DNA-binding NarL/FixJ family response regulator
MRQAYAIEQRFGRTDPATQLWHADFVEALAAVGARDEAREVLDEVAAVGRELRRDVVKLGLARADAVLTAAEGDARAAAAGLAAAMADNENHPYPMEVARAWHALATLERRAHRRAAARSALVEAVARYAAAGAAPWLDVARSELARLDGATTGLSASEQRIVELLLAGATNREIAAATFLSVKAVEANLTRLYRRHGVRNRAQLIAVLGPAAAGSVTR